MEAELLSRPVQHGVRLRSLRTASELAADGYQLQGNVFIGVDDRYLPLYEAKMLHQFDHRFSTYEGATQNQLNVGILPQPSAEQKRDPKFAVHPRYWVREDIVDSAIPDYPEPLAAALKTGDNDTVRCVLLLWAAGFHFERNSPEAARIFFDTAAALGCATSFASALTGLLDNKQAVELQRDFPLTETDVETITYGVETPIALARDFIKRFSPKWFVGWRDITNSGNERTLIASVLPRTAVGHTLPLAFFPGMAAKPGFGLLASLNSFVIDYAARQKVGGTHITYNLLKQFPCPAPSALTSTTLFSPGESMQTWILPRVIELVCTTNDLTVLARDCDVDSPLFRWDEQRRFEIRCELDAAFFHLYLPSEPNKTWRKVEGETPAQLETLKRHFPTPRDAVSHILDQFPVIRQKDEHLFGGRYRTKERIREIYDAMLAATRSGQPFRTSLNPPPGALAAEREAVQ